MARDIALFLPGVSGSYLRDRRTGRLTWGTPRYILAWVDYSHARLPFRPGEEDLATHGPVLDTVWFCRRLGLGIPFYERCFRVIRQRAGRRQGTIERPDREADFYPWPFDWRRSLVETAQRLDETVERLIDLHQDPDLKITLICHSNGGLAARYWWAYGGADVLGADDPPPPHFPRRRNLGRLIHVGVPNRGTLKLLYDTTNGITVVPGGRKYRPDFLFPMPPLYEGLPFESAGRFVDVRDEPLEIDLFDPETWYRWRLGAFTLCPHLMEDPAVRSHLEKTLRRARRFQRALSHPWPDDLVDTVHIIASRAFQTMRRMRLTPQGVDLRGTRRSVRRGRWHPGLDERWVERGDWFAPFDSLVGLPHRPDHMHEVNCIHRHLFSDPLAQEALVETLTRSRG